MAPEAYEHYLALVSMTTTLGRLLVTCVGGFACAEWVLHNRLNREKSLWQRLAVQNENRLHESCSGTIAGHAVKDDEAARDSYLIPDQHESY